jgi:hypothetical protein
MAATKERRRQLAEEALKCPLDVDLQHEIATELDRANSVYLINSIVGMVLTVTAVWTPVQAAEMFVQPWVRGARARVLHGAAVWLLGLRRLRGHAACVSARGHPTQPTAPAHLAPPLPLHPQPTPLQPSQPTMTASLDAVERWLDAKRASSAPSSQGHQP